MLLFLACTPQVDGPDSVAPQDTAVACADGSGGTLSGSVDCQDGVCEVPGGAFWMGSDQGGGDECPVRRVTLSAYAIDQTEVSYEAYEACADCPAPSCGQGSEFPVTCVSWESAQTYCAWAGGHLPTEAEWEMAARGTDGAPYAWGSSSPTCGEANFRFSSWYCAGAPLPVGSFDVLSPFGLQDTVGNVWEWTADSYDFDWYAQAPDTDPEGPELCNATEGGQAGACTHRVIRGGAFNSLQETIRSSRRAQARPEVLDDNLGFRCAYSR